MYKINSPDDLFKKITKYSAIKTLSILPASILAIVATIVFVIIILLSIFISIPAWVVTVLAAIMMAGIIVPIIVISLLGKSEDDIINCDFRLYLEMFSCNQFKNKFIHYDAIDLFQTKVRVCYINYSHIDFSNKEFEIINFLHSIFFINGMRTFRIMPYNYPKLFQEWCNYATNISVADQLIIQKDIRQYYENLQLKEPESRKSSGVSIKFTSHILKKTILFALIIATICWFRAPNPATIVINFASIILLAADISNKGNR